MIKNKLYLIILITILFVNNKPHKTYQNLFIENLRKRTFAKNSLKIEKKVDKEYKHFDGFIASYYSDGLKLYTLINKPKVKKEKYPVVILNHGHIPPHVYDTVYSYRLVNTYFANNGFLVLKPDYRGHDNSEKGKESTLTRLGYPVDVLNLLYALPSLDYADMDNIFMYGHSMGGGITLAVLEAYPNIKAATLWAPVSVEFPESTLYFRRKHNKEEAEKLLKEWNTIFTKEEFKKLSPINYLSFIKTPILLQHGTQDDSVPFDWSTNLIEKFKENNIDYQFHSYDDDHNFAKKYFYVVLKRDVEFFKKHFK